MIPRWLRRRPRTLPGQAPPLPEQWAVIDEQELAAQVEDIGRRLLADVQLPLQPAAGCGARRGKNVCNDCPGGGAHMYRSPDGAVTWWVP